MSSMVLKEFISYYSNEGSDVDVCLIDASKAFDRVNFCKFFDIYLGRKIPAFIIRLIMDSYLRQKICVKWQNSLSDPLETSNGVKHGSVLSPKLFAVYLDVLLNRLENQESGCRIGSRFFGALAYADDLTLLSPSLHGLQKLITQCELYGSEFDIIFNEKKTICIKFGRNVHDHSDVFMCGSKLVWSTKVKHLDNIFSSNMNDKDDINYKKGCTYGYVFKTLAHFSSLPCNILDLLFQTYCTSFYGSSLWHMTSKYVTDIYTEWQKSVRRIWSIPYQTHIKFLPLLSCCTSHLSVSLILRFCKLFHTMLSSKNSAVSYIAIRSFYAANSTMSANRFYIYIKYDIDISKLSYSYVRYYVLQRVNSINKECVTEVNVLKELCYARDGLYNIIGFSKSETVSVIHDLSVT